MDVVEELLLELEIKFKYRNNRSERKEKSENGGIEVGYLSQRVFQVAVDNFVVKVLFFIHKLTDLITERVRTKKRDLQYKDDNINVFTLRKLI